MKRRPRVPGDLLLAAMAMALALAAAHAQESAPDGAGEPPAHMSGESLRGGIVAPPDVPDFPRPARFRELDADASGTLTRDELRGKWVVQASFADLDFNQDGSLTPDEYATFQISLTGLPIRPRPSDAAPLPPPRFK